MAISPIFSIFTLVIATKFHFTNAYTLPNSNNKTWQSNLTHSKTKIKLIPTILVFGDSTMDTGNNNFITSVLRSNHLPYGQNFPTHIPTGRFSNGKLIPDFVASLLGIKQSVPPYLDPNLSTDDILTGVNFASAGSGYDDMTNEKAGVIPVTKQLVMFKEYMNRLNGIIGVEEAKNMINGALFVVSAGTNDFAYNYYDVRTRRPQFTDISGYQDFILNLLKDFVEDLYNLGARRMAIAGLPPIGCLPIQITAKFKINRSCIEEQNTDSQGYNQKLLKLLGSLKASLSGTRLAYANFYDPLMDMIIQPQKYGFVDTNKGCCGTGLVETAFLCNSATPLCETVAQYLFWDCIHPNEVAYKSISDYVVKEINSSFSS